MNDHKHHPSLPLNTTPAQVGGFLRHIGVSASDDEAAAGVLVGSTVGTLIGKGLIVLCAFIGAATGNVVCAEQRAVPVPVPAPSLEQQRGACVKERYDDCLPHAPQATTRVLCLEAAQRECLAFRPDLFKEAP